LKFVSKNWEGIAPTLGFMTHSTITCSEIASLKTRNIVLTPVLSFKLGSVCLSVYLPTYLPA